MPRGSTYLGEDANYYYWMEPGATDQLGGFFDNIGNMFTRMVKFTPKSFTPGNIYKGFVNTSLTAMTGGLYQVLPKDIKKTVYDVGKIAIPVVAGGIAAYTMGPAVMATLMPKLSAAASILGKGAGFVGNLFGGGGGSGANPDASQMQDPRYHPPGEMPSGSGINWGEKASTIGGVLMGFLSRLPQNKQAEVVQQLTPEDIAYTERYGQVPPRLQPYFDQMAQETFGPPAPPSTGAGELYGPPAPSPGAAQAGMFGNLDMSTILMFAVPLGFYFLTQSGKRR